MEACNRLTPIEGQKENKAMKKWEGEKNVPIAQVKESFTVHHCDHTWDFVRHVDCACLQSFIRIIFIGNRVDVFVHCCVLENKAQGMAVVSLRFLFLIQWLHRHSDDSHF